MDDDTRELLGRLFARATMALEDAHEIAVKGQMSKHTAKAVSKCAVELKRIALEVSVLADAALVVSRRR